MTHLLREVGFRDAEKIYDRLMILAGDMEKYLSLYGYKMSRRDYEDYHARMIAVQSIANQLYIASHSAEEQGNG